MTIRPLPARTIAALLIGVAFACPASADHENIPIEPLATYAKLDPARVTVSGISSGAFFAHQFHVAFSSFVEGAGFVAGGPYACAEQTDSIVPPFGNPFLSGGVPKSVVASLAVCTHFARAFFAQLLWSFPQAPDAALSRQSAFAAHRQGKIDDPANLATSRIFLFHGDKDELVPRSTMTELKRFYLAIGVPAANIEEREGPDAKHGMPVKALPAPSGTHCALPDPSYLVHCDYGAAELLLQNLYPGSAPASGAMPGRIVGFDQTAFFDRSDERTSLNHAGYLYVPAACEHGAPPVRCRLHVAFHGCEQYVAKIHGRFFRDAGYNAWADANNIVVLYPQAASWNRLADPTGLTANPKGCWDWWGYSGDHYFTREGKQMKAVRGMIARMLP